MLYNRIKQIKISITKLTFPIRAIEIHVIEAVKKSKKTIIFRLLILSAINPPIGVAKIIGMNEHADTIPKSEADFVMLSI